MRSVILVILSAAALGGLFVFVWTLQPASSTMVKDDPRITPPPPVKDREGYGPIKPGERVYIKQYDHNGQLVSRFSGDQFLPQHDGTVRITNPEADFYLANHQHMEIRGTEGDVVMKDVPNLGQGGFANAGTPAPPSRGRLNQVTVRIVDEIKHVALLTMRTNNVVFDNETYRISTEGYKDDQGNLIADDQVPVTVDGQIKMRGRGLTVRWNDKDGRLELLEIAHGDVLEITDPSNLSLGGGKSAKPAGMGHPAARAGRPLPEMLAAADKRITAQVLTHHPAPQTRPQAAAEPRTSRPTTPPIYRATFYDNVRINQLDPAGKGDQILIDNVDRMDVDFLMKQSSAVPATQPAQAPVSSQAAPATAPAAPATEASPATQPAAPKEPPIFVHWTGVLKITPLQSAPMVPLQPGDSSVLLTGVPVTIHRVDPKGQGTEDIRSATVLYATAGERVTLGKSHAFPQIRVDQTPAASAKSHEPTHLVSSGWIQYSRVEGKTLLSGPGTAEVPLEPDPKAPHPKLHAAWSKLAEFDFSPESAGGQPTVQFGRFEGDVDIQHPKLTLKSQTLDLLFDPPTKASGKADLAKTSSQPNIRQIIATTGVKCDVEGADGKPQHLTGERLVLDTEKADGKLYARHLLATGNAHAWGEDDLRAGSIDVLLHPSKKKSVEDARKKQGDDTAAVELERMEASDNVVARSKDGSVANGDDLLVTTVDGKQHTVLTSRTNATVTDAKGNIVRGPRVEFDSADGRAHVIGPGSMHAIQQASTTQPAQPVDVVWTVGALFDGEANHIDVYGAVRATSTDKKGYVDTATGDHIRIDLRAKPTTQPIETTSNPDASLVKAQGDAVGNLKMDPFKGKEVSAITIEKGANLTSTLSAPSGDVLQQFVLEGPTLHVDQFAPDGSPSRRITVPAAGRMLVRDHRPQERKEKSPGDESSGARGATAFQWSKQLVYAEATHQADMLGDVVIVHQDDDSNAPKVTMESPRVIAWFEPAPKVANKNANADTTAMQLHYLSAEGDHVIIRRDTDTIDARQVDYDPEHHVLIATGTERNPVTFDNGGASSGTARRIEWDTITWKMKMTDVMLNNRPPVPAAQSPAPAAKKKPDLPAPSGNNRR
jgi:hypothetical protein